MSSVLHSATRRGRGVVAALLLAVVAVLVPDASPHIPSVALVRVTGAAAVDHPRDVVWILALGSDARVGEPPLRSRADAIQLVGVNLRTGTGAVIGIPRDSWTAIPGHGSNRVNAGLELGGPELMAATVAGLVGVRPDYVFVTTFSGLKSMVTALGGVTVRSRLSFTDDNMAGRIHEGWNKLDGPLALFFGRARHLLPRGDFDRSANQQELLRATLRKVRAQQDQPGYMERAVLSATKNLYTDLSPVELYRLAQAATRVDPERFRGCVIRGSLGTVNGASIVFPDREQARRIGTDVRGDAQLDGGC